MSPDVPRVVLQAVGLAAAAIAAVALPSAFVPHEPPAGTGDVVIVLDVSMSMRAADVVPDRLSEARRQAIAMLHAAAPGRAGIVVFAGDARVICPLTRDVDAAIGALAGATPTAAAAGGSNVAEALRRAGELLPHHAKGARVILLTDGETGPNEEDAPGPFARALAARGHALTVVGVGTARGAPVPLRDRGEEEFVQERMAGGARRPRLSRLNPSRLMTLAQEAGGRYVELEDGASLHLRDLAAPGDVIDPLTPPASVEAPAFEAGRAKTFDPSRSVTLLIVVAIGALLLDTALWWLRRSTNPWG
jgi:Ca-activated chloride channel homolog